MKTPLFFCNIIFLILNFLVGGVAKAEIAPGFDSFFKAVKFNCQVIAITQGGSILEKKFTVNQNSKGHGGEDFVFEDGLQKIVGMADGTWMGLEWYVKGKLVAKGLFAQNQNTVESRVLVLFNPAEEDDQLSLDCQKIQK